MNEIWSYVITAAGSGGIVGVVNIILNRRKQSAEANAVEIKSSVLINREWQTIYDNLKIDYESFKIETEARSDARDKELKEIQTELKEVFKQLEECKKRNHAHTD